MDASHFDDLARSLASPSRRTILRRLAGAAFGGMLVPVLGEDVAAHDALLTCKKLKGDKKKKCVKNAKKHNATHTTPTPTGGGGSGTSPTDSDPCAGVQ